jgi:hypothetical protein
MRPHVAQRCSGIVELIGGADNKRRLVIAFAQPRVVGFLAQPPRALLLALALALAQEIRAVLDDCRDPFAEEDLMRLSIFLPP